MFPGNDNMEAVQDVITVCVEPKFMQVQTACLRRCIEQHKWFMSEKAHYDVGWEAAQADFTETYLNGFAAGFRACYCGSICPKRTVCAIGQKYIVS